MKVQYLLETDYSNWDNFVDNSPQGYIWNYSWWLETITNSDFKICVLLDDDDIIVAGISLPYFSTHKIHMPLLTQSLGILFEDMNKRNNMRLQKQLTNQKEYTIQLFEYIKRDISFFSLRFNYNYEYWLPLYWKGCSQTTWYTYVIDYSNYILEDEFKRFSKGHKWILNKVEKKSDLKVVKTNDIEEYLKESDKTYLRQGVKKPYSNELVRRLHREISSRGLGTILKIIDSEERVHAIAYYLHNNKEAYYWLGASDEQLRDSGGHTYLTWHAIKYFSTRTRFFNFGGSMIEHVERNFRNFSAYPKQYFLITYNHTFSSRVRSVLKSAIVHLFK